MSQEVFDCWLQLRWWRLQFLRDSHSKQLYCFKQLGELHGLHQWNTQHVIWNAGEMVPMPSPHDFGQDGHEGLVMFQSLKKSDVSITILLQNSSRGFSPQLTTPWLKGSGQTKTLRWIWATQTMSWKKGQRCHDCSHQTWTRMRMGYFNLVRLLSIVSRLNCSFHTCFHHTVHRKCV